MNILTDLNTIYSLDALNEPSPFTHFWVLDAKMLDFRLTDFDYIEEATGAAVRMRIENQEIEIPGSWHVLVVDRENYTVDSVPVSMVAALNHEMLLFSPHDSKVNGTRPIFLDVVEKNSTIYPMVPKACAFIMPVMKASNGLGVVSPYGIILGPYDLGRWIEGKTVGDILC